MIVFFNYLPLTVKTTRLVDESTRQPEVKEAKRKNKGNSGKQKYLIFAGARITQSKFNQSTFVSIRSSLLANNLP